MAKDVKHQVIIDGVVVGERRSPRTYTHAIVADHDAAPHEARVRRERAQSALSNWNYNAKIARSKVGDRKWPDKPVLADLVWSARDIADAEAWIAANPDVNEYIAREVAEAVAMFCECPDGTTFVCQWSQSEANAVKGARAFSKPHYHHRNVRVVPVTRHA